MPLLFILNKKDVALAEAEAKAAVYGWGWWDAKERTHDGMLLFPRARKAPQGLGLTRRIVKVIAQGPAQDARGLIASTPWERHLKGKSYRVSLSREGTKDAMTERDAAKLVWERAKGVADVDLSHPDVTVDIVLTTSRAYAGLRAWEGDEGFHERRAHRWPAPHPSATHPSVARALVRLPCARRIHDPFCGAGGFLIEAGLAGIDASGADIDPGMIARARENCAAYRLRPALTVADATLALPRAQALVCDLPYGKSTRGASTLSLLEAFLLRAKASTRRLVIGVPSPLRETHGWAVRGHFPMYVHSGMTRHFYALERGGRR